MSGPTTVRRIPLRKAWAGLAGAALVVSLTACGEAPQTVANVQALKGDTTAIKLDKGFTDALTKLKLTPGVVGTAKLQEGSLVFPITGGNVSVYEPGEVSPYVIGQIQHVGSGLSLTAGGTTVSLTNFNVDPAFSKVYGDVAVNGKVAASSAFLFALDGRSLKPLESKGSTAVLEGTKVKVSDVAAPLLNDTFKTNAVKPGLLVGVAKITIKTR